MCAVGEKIPVFFFEDELVGFHGSFGVSFVAVILQFQQASGGNCRTDDFDFFNGRILMVPYFFIVIPLLQFLFQKNPITDLIHSITPNQRDKRGTA